MRSIRFRRLICGSPTTLIRDGVIEQDALRRNRFTVDELLEELRAQGVRDIATVEYAFLETNGKLSILQYESETPPSAAALNVAVENGGFPRILISDGRLISENLRRSGYEETWLMKQIQPYGGRIADIFLLTVDDAARVYCVRKERER